MAPNPKNPRPPRKPNSGGGGPRRGRPRKTKRRTQEAHGHAVAGLPARHHHFRWRRIPSGHVWRSRRRAALRARTRQRADFFSAAAAPAGLRAAGKPRKRTAAAARAAAPRPSRAAARGPTRPRTREDRPRPPEPEAGPGAGAQRFAIRAQPPELSPATGQGRGGRHDRYFDRNRDRRPVPAAASPSATTARRARR
jgi:hypothetical protein